MGKLANVSISVLPDFQKFLADRNLVPDRNIPFHAHWISRYLQFVQQKGIAGSEYHETEILEFLENLRENGRVQDWQVPQAADALQLSGSTTQKAERMALNKDGIHKHASVHTFRHSFATHLLQSGVNIREVQSLLGHKNVETTMVYTHVLWNMANAPKSPLDALYAEATPRSGRRSATITGKWQAGYSRVLPI